MRMMSLLRLTPNTQCLRITANCKHGNRLTAYTKIHCVVQAIRVMSVRVQIFDSVRCSIATTSICLRYKLLILKKVIPLVSVYISCSDVDRVNVAGRNEANRINHDIECKMLIAIF